MSTAGSPTPGRKLVGVTSDAAIREIVLGMWSALSARDWDTLEDVPVRRLPLRRHADACRLGPRSRGHRHAAEDRTRVVVVVREPRRPAAHQRCRRLYEHSETWGWHSGRNRPAGVRFGAPCRGRQGHPLEGLLGLQHVADLRRRNRSPKAWRPPTRRGFSTPPIWSDDARHRLQAIRNFSASASSSRSPKFSCS